MPRHRRRPARSHTDEVFGSGTVHVQTSGGRLWCVRPHEAHAWPRRRAAEPRRAARACRAGDARASTREPSGATCAAAVAAAVARRPPAARTHATSGWRRDGPTAAAAAAAPRACRAMTNESGPEAPPRAPRRRDHPIGAAARRGPGAMRGRAALLRALLRRLRRPPEGFSSTARPSARRVPPPARRARELVRAGGRDKAHIHRRVATAALRVGQYEAVAAGAARTPRCRLERGGVDEAQSLAAAAFASRGRRRGERERERERERGGGFSSWATCG